jgi:hypothetical protein
MELFAFLLVRGIVSGSTRTTARSGTRALYAQVLQSVL